MVAVVAFVALAALATADVPSVDEMPAAVKPKALFAFATVT